MSGWIGGWEVGQKVLCNGYGAEVLTVVLVYWHGHLRLKLRFADGWTSEVPAAYCRRVDGPAA